jgi:hypothetical protein
MSLNNPFAWKSNPRDSIFATDPKFAAYRNGKSRSQVMSETTDRITRETGKNPGTLHLTPASVGRIGFANQTRKKRG